MLIGQVIKSEPLADASFDGSEQAFVINGIEVEIDNTYGAWEKRRITLFVRREGSSRMHAYSISSSVRAGFKKEKDIGSEDNVTAFRFRWVENGRTLFSEMLEISQATTFESAYIQWVATTDGHPDSVGLAGGLRE